MESASQGPSLKPKQISAPSIEELSWVGKQSSHRAKSLSTVDDSNLPGLTIKKIRMNKKNSRESRHLASSWFPQDRAHFSLSLFHDTKAILIGGASADQEYSDVWEFNLRTRCWQKKMELTDPLSGHQSLKLRVLTKDSIVKGTSRGFFTFGGWQMNKYNDAIYMLDTVAMHMKKCPRTLPKLKADEYKGAKSMIDPKKRIELEKSIPEGRRDHTLLYNSELNAVVMIGGWDALEWSPHNVGLEIWLYRSDWRWKRVTWKSTSTAPLNRRGHSAVYDDRTSSIYMFGGVFGYSKVLGDLHKIQIGDDLIATSVELKKKSEWDLFPDARAWHSATLVGREMVLIGGLQSMVEVVGDILMYNLDYNRWLRVAHNDSRVERCAHSAVEYSGTILVFGGYKYTKLADPDCESLDQSGGGSSSRAGSLLCQEPKPLYCSLSEVLVLNLNQQVEVEELGWVCTYPWEKAFRRSKSLDERCERREKGHERLEWNMVIFPTDQLSHQMEGFGSIQRSGLVQHTGTASRQPEVTSDPFADLKDTD